MKNHKSISNMVTNNTLLIRRDYLKELQAPDRTLKRGDDGIDVKRSVQWLRLWQLTLNNVTTEVGNTKEFDSKVEGLVKEIQGNLGLDPNGIIDQNTWRHLVAPMERAFDIQSYKYTTLAWKMVYFSLRHLQYRACELDEKNLGPWVRSYMYGKDGEIEYWCQGFVCSILDQSFSSIGQRFDSFYADTDTCEVARQYAAKRDLLISHKDLKSGKYIPKPGDMALYINDKNNRAHHTEIIFEVLDEKIGVLRTVGGNTNFGGSRDGVGVFLVDRNFKTQTTEVIKIIDMPV